jgi:hypothetical protein
MRSSILVLALATGAAALSGCEARAPGESAQVRLADASARKPGLWEQRLSDGQGGQVLRFCVDRTSESALSALGRQANAACEKHEMVHAGEGVWRFTTVCNVGGVGRVTTSGEISGDFTSRYRVNAESEVAGQAARTKVVVDNVWLGDCPADMRAGDMVDANGVRRSIADLTKTG